MSCNNGKSCSSKWCGWLQSFAQLAVATVILYAGYVVIQHMQAWTDAFNRGSNDLHNISNEMSKIRHDMEIIKVQMDGMNVNTAGLNQNFARLNHQMDAMNYQVHGIRDRFTPIGMMRGMMPW